MTAERADLGIVMALAFVKGERMSRPLVVTFLAVLVLRWIPFHDIVIWRELIILAGAVGVAYVMNGTGLAILVIGVVGMLLDFLIARLQMAVTYVE